MTQLITINASLAAALLRDLADKVEAEEVELTSIDNVVWEVLHKGHIKIDWHERRSSE